MSEAKAQVSTRDALYLALKSDALDFSDKGMTVKELSEVTGRTESQLRRALNARNLGWDWLSESVEWRTSHSRSYKGFESGVHKVTVYSLTRRELLRLLKNVCPTA